MSIKKCTCKHEDQDQLHGKGLRVHTTDKKGNEHCTVCGPKPAWENRLAAHAKQWTPAYTPKKEV